jgi:hypothetical protein
MEGKALRTRKRVEKLVERDEPGKNEGGERAWPFELASSTWNKLSANNGWTHAHTNCGHTNYVACVSSPLRVSMCPRLNGGRRRSSVENTEGSVTGVADQGMSGGDDKRRPVIPTICRGTPVTGGEISDVLLSAVVYTPVLTT